MSLSGLVWQYLKLRWFLGVGFVGFVAVAGLFGDGPLSLVVGAFVLVVAALVYGFSRVVLQG